ncbi:unnamed protein product [Angiostrongylus costaricensis]|uniref:DUF3330 domain-containing protein n=1 Tax=Angiostrongylus costaricensis TaxID=334426 RepID=A0A0R3PPP8_ANGCS|nr:unnamed protein product [Angiostrongylus costaricensis]
MNDCSFVFDILPIDSKMLQFVNSNKYPLYCSRPTPILAIPFIDNSTVQHENASYVSLRQVFSPPETVDDEIGLPLHQPLKGQKVSFNRYLDPYLQYRYPYGRRK